MAIDRHLRRINTPTLGPGWRKTVYGDRHRNATPTVGVVRLLKTASCENSCRICCSLPKLTYSDIKVWLSQEPASLLYTAVAQNGDW